MFENIKKDERLKKAKELFNEAISADLSWQQEAREDFLFRDGFQWTSKEKEILERELRPALTFNLTKSSVDLIMGLNEDNRVNFRAVPQENNDDFLCEVLNTLDDWANENYEFEQEEDTALESAAICGRGYVAVDFAPDPKRFGEIVLSEVVVPVHEIRFDPSARRSDLSDASYITWDRWITPEDFRLRFPKKSIKEIEGYIEDGTAFTLGSEGGIDKPDSIMDAVPEPDTEESDYDRPLDMDYYDRTKRMIRLVHMEYWTSYKRFFGLNPATKEWEEFEQKNLKELKKTIKAKYKKDFQWEIIVDKRVNWIQFIGDEILYDGPSPLPYDGFSIVPMFAFKDVSQRTTNHFGIVRLMKDPQREINKRWSQALNLLNQSAQPGAYAEIDAFVDLDQAKLSMKEPGDITLLNSGGMNKFKERAMPNFPSAPMQMEEYSQEVMRKITGINPDLLGQDRGRQEPGVVVRMRQQQGIILLKPLFRGFKKMRRELFKRRLAIIMAFMPSSQIQRILGDGRFIVDPAQGIIADRETEMTADIRNLKNLEYNIKTEEATSNMSKRMLELSTFLEMQKAGFPVEPAVIINRLDLPATEKVRWMQFIDAQQQSAAQAQQEAMQIEAQLKDREVGAKEKQVLYDFMLGLAKVKQQAQKEEMKQASGDKQLESMENQALLQFISELVKVGQQERAAQKQIESKKGETKNDKSK